MLAPMDDVTDTAFRQVIAGTAKPDIFFTEFVNVDGLQSPGRKNLLKKLQFTRLETPLVAQIWGKVPENFYKTAQQLADGTFARELGLPEDVNFAGIDLNMGCPDKTVVKNGACSALINNRELAREIIQATKAGAAAAKQPIPVSVKTRLGFNTVDVTWPEFLLRQDIAMLTVHGRTRKEMSKVPARWEDIGQVGELRDRIASQTLIVGNGDVLSRQQGITLAKQYGLDGIMVGRGIFHDPFLFAETTPWETYTPAQRLDLFAQHIRFFMEAYPNGERALPPLYKFCKVYANGFDGAKELREALVHARTPEDLLAILAGYGA